MCVHANMNVFSHAGKSEKRSLTRVTVNTIFKYRAGFV